ncbi:protein NDNF-like [Bufo gargarizans]|uniref:protein NDNF-like n=1 Tax=Bufo gargarizans TaxID=30331 RepID=UPI001CF2FC5B|nr:protein NDNF-like [Bufo gargarizans]
MGGLETHKLLWGVHLAVLLAGSLSHSNLPPSDDYRKIYFNPYHSLILPDGRETTIYLLKDITKRYYFTLGENTSPHFSITVTPCDVPIEWSILHYKVSHAFYGKTAVKYQPFADLKTQLYYKTVSTLFHYKGNSVENYVGTFLYSSLFVLEFLSTERDTHISVYLTTDLAHGSLFPELPGDPRIDVTTVNHNSVSLVWKPSPSAMKQKDIIEYCILVNEKHNYKSMCAADTAIRSAGRKWPKLTSFPISKYLEENQRVMLISSRDLHIIHKSSNMEVRQICIDNKNTYTVSNLSSNTQYYFDVFVVNLLTNASAAYTGTFTKTWLEPKPKDIPLKDGKIVQIKFDGKRSKAYSFQYQALHKKVHFTLQVCRGQMRALISKNGKLLISENVQGLRHITLKGKFMDKYVAVFRSAEPVENTSAMIQASSHMHKSVFPFFPNSLKIKSFNKLRTCNSITIAWLGTQERNMYCVYKKKLKEDQVWREISSVDNCSGPESRPKSEKVLCKYFHEINVQRAVTTETIGGLERGTSYRFDVYLIGSSGLLVRYQSKIVKTRKTC